MVLKLAEQIVPWVRLSIIWLAAAIQSEIEVLVTVFMATGAAEQILCTQEFPASMSAELQTTKVPNVGLPA